MRKIAVFGAGYVGLITALGFARLGNRVYSVDKDRGKIEKLLRGEAPFYEPGLQELLEEVGKTGLISFHTDGKEAVKEADIIFICVGTPSLPDGRADLSQVEAVARFIAENMEEFKIIVEKSTVPVRTSFWIKRTISLYNKRKVDFEVASNPEFLREGSAIQDFFNPERIVIGVESERVANVLRDLYRDFSCPILVTDINTAEIIKHASNSFLAMKISFINMISDLCEKTGADVDMVARGMGLDSRIGEKFLKAGVGYGGSCFPKDVKAFYRIAEEHGLDFSLLKEVDRINSERAIRFVAKIKKALWNLKGKKIAVFGLAFKPNTDDVREAPSLRIIQLLLDEGAEVAAYDPKAMENAAKVLKRIEYASSPYEAASGSNAIALVTEWDEFRQLDWGRIASLMETPIVFDGRNFLDGDRLAELGFEYYPVGKPPVLRNEGGRSS